jgi:hypothetical protein
MMISRLMTLLACIACMTIITAAPVMAQEEPGPALAACRAELNSLARLACYDRLADTLAGTAADTVADTPAKTLAETQEQTDQFGAPQSAPDVGAPAQTGWGLGIRRLIPGLGPKEEQQAPQVTKTDDDGVEDFGTAATPAKIATVDEPFGGDAQVIERNEQGKIMRVRMPIRSYRVNGYGAHIFTMENGQVWRQVGDTSRVYIPKGPVFAEIRVAFRGSHLMTLNGKGRAIRVSRDKE